MLIDDVGRVVRVEEVPVAQLHVAQVFLAQYIEPVDIKEDTRSCVPGRHKHQLHKALRVPSDNPRHDHGTPVVRYTYNLLDILMVQQLGEMSAEALQIVCLEVGALVTFSVAEAVGRNNSVSGCGQVRHLMSPVVP